MALVTKIKDMPTCDAGGDAVGLISTPPTALVTLEVASTEGASGASIVITSGNQTIMDATVLSLLGRLLRPGRVAQDNAGADLTVVVPFICLATLDIVISGGALNEVVTVTVSLKP